MTIDTLKSSNFAQRIKRKRNTTMKMTIQDLYNWAKKNNALDKKISIWHGRTMSSYRNEDVRLENREDYVSIE